MPIVLMLEDDEERLDRFEAVAAKLGVELVSWADARAMLAEVGPLIPTAALISLDHDLMPIHDIEPGDGLDVAKYLATLPPACPVIIHTSNRLRGDAMEGELDLAGWTYHRVASSGLAACRPQSRASRPLHAATTGSRWTGSASRSGHCESGRTQSRIHVGGAR